MLREQDQQSELLQSVASQYNDRRRPRLPSSFGVHIFVCRGHCLIPTGLKQSEDLFLASLFLTVAPVIVWFVFVGRRFTGIEMYVLMGIVGVLFVLALSFLLAAHFVEPGIMNVESNILETNFLVVHKGQLFELSNFRAKFCRVTNNCIARFDHFCPWVSNAVGARNYKHFYFFLLFTTLLSLAAGGTSVYLLVLNGQSSTHTSSSTTTNNSSDFSQFSFAVEADPAAIIIAVYSFLVCVFVGPLLVYHTWLVSRNLTTNEHIKGVYTKGNRNPHDQGCCVNCCAVLCAPSPTSEVLHVIDV
eukprot:c10760_g1_i1.p1 GENE.c10760_g1_i1~~c10760_g1_i1.p1  ORF type:complete len:302 (+),score=68.77 c10760_g1_i1:34-939(+)